MTDPEFQAFVSNARIKVDAELARLDAIDWSALSAHERAILEKHRQDWIALRDSMTDEALRAELEATEHAGRDLTPDEVAAIRKRH